MQQSETRLTTSSHCMDCGIHWDDGHNQARDHAYRTGHRVYHRRTVIHEWNRPGR